jgi:hypothetical protein
MLFQVVGLLVGVNVMMIWFSIAIHADGQDVVLTMRMSFNTPWRVKNAMSGPG